MHYLHKHLVDKRIINTLVQEDDIIYGKVGTSASAFKRAMDGKTVLDARQQGKYFYLVMSSPPHPVMHFGMTGWIKFSNDDSSYYKAKKEEDNVWPPRFWKFVLDTGKVDGKECQVAFVDPRRLGRIRLVDVPGDQLRDTTPLKENGPDPVIDKDILTVEWLGEKMRSKRVPIKAFLLDQAIISGIGNWVGDEVLHGACIHPEQYSNTFSDEQIAALHKSLISVCTIACETMSDQDKFPSDWIMKYRWDKGKKDGNILPNGDKITHITVGGRTSAVVLSRQKKTGRTADENKAKANDQKDHSEDDVKQGSTTGEQDGSGNINDKENHNTEADTDSTAKQGSTAKRRKTKHTRDSGLVDAGKPKTNAIKGGTNEQSGRRRSARLSK